MIIYEETGPVDTGFSGSQQPIIQNLGPGDLHFGTSPEDLIENGIFLPAGAVYEFPATLSQGAGKVFIQVCTSGVSSDVRIINVG
jgi:hypothetical protein